MCMCAAIARPVSFEKRRRHATVALGYMLYLVLTTAFSALMRLVEWRLRIVQ